MMANLPTRAMLGAADIDRLTAVMHTLLAEVAVLSERVAALESAGRPAGADMAAPAQQRIDALTARVLRPLTG